MSDNKNLDFIDESELTDLEKNILHNFQLHSEEEQLAIIGRICSMLDT